MSVTLSLAVAVALLVPLGPRLADATDRLSRLDPTGLALAVGLQIAALISYSRMTLLAVEYEHEHERVGLIRMVGIQFVSRAVSMTLPMGAAVGPATGHRLMTNAGVSPSAAAASLASVSLLSAVVLNAGLWVSLVVSVPVNGFRPVYAAAALVGIVAMSIAVASISALSEGSRIVDRAVRVVARRFGVDGSAVSDALRSVGRRVEDLLRRRWPLVRRLGRWAAANWWLDAASLWVVLQMFGVEVAPVGVAVAFGVANVLAAIPLTPGGIGIVDWAYITLLVSFGAGLDSAAIAVATYRVLQFAVPITLGTVASAWFAVEGAIGRRQRAHTCAG